MSGKQQSWSEQVQISGQPPWEISDESLNVNVRGLQPSATVAINELADALRQQGQQIFKLGLGQSPFPVPEPVVASLQQHAREKDYLAVAGLRPLREAVAQNHQREFGIACDPDDVIIGPGSKELMFLLQLVFDGQLIIPSPSWVSYEPQARIIGRDVQVIKTCADRDWHLTAEDLERFCLENRSTKPRILVLNYPSNPSGQTLSRERLAELADSARRHRVIILSDEIYGKLSYLDDHHSIVPIYPEGTIFSGGLSKWCGAGGWQLGLFVFPKPLRRILQAMKAVASETYTSTCAPVQYAAVTAFTGSSDIEDYLWHCRRILNRLGQWVSGEIRRVGAAVSEPRGGFYVFPDFSPLRQSLSRRGITSSAELCRQLLHQTGVAILPGSAFGRPAEELTARLAFVDFDGRRALEASRTLGPRDELDEQFLQQYCGDVMEAIWRLNRFARPSG